jgi:sec-independent protein translocase protein TatB
VENSIAQNIAEVENAWHDTPATPTFSNATTDDLSRKAREFRRKKLVRSSAIPAWYKQRHGGKLHVTSGAARVARFRPRGTSQATFY